MFGRQLWLIVNVTPRRHWALSSFHRFRRPLPYAIIGVFSWVSYSIVYVGICFVGKHWSYL